ncbi:MAG TPA: formate dehydrogenase accessory sulfurtransferase FdhD, partial [Vulgatibacter sp.]
MSAPDDRGHFARNVVTPSVDAWPEERPDAAEATRTAPSARLAEPSGVERQAAAEAPEPAPSVQHADPPGVVLQSVTEAPSAAPSARQAVAPGVVAREMERVDAGGRRAPEPDSVVEEEPLEIRIDGESIAVIMRTPGEDRDLALGFLYGEGIVRSMDDVGEVAPCGRPGHEGFGNAIRISSAPGTIIDADRIQEGRRWTTATSACGVCGRRSIDELVARCGVVEGGPLLASRTIELSLAAMRARQARFDRTGGIHAAAAFDAGGGLLEIHEDVGRHNAVDKTVGALLRKGLLDRAALLTVSGRAGFEIVQKAAAARIPVVASVSASSSLAIDLAKQAGVTLAAFARGGAASVYAHGYRIVPPPLVGVFVGGRSRRMAGRPKGLIPLGGRTIVERTVGLVKAMGLRCVLVGDAPAYRERLPDLPVLADRPGEEGPMAGMASLLEAAGSGQAIALACDMPFLSEA